MKRCPNCNAVNNEDNRFCFQCKEKLEPKQRDPHCCRICETELPPGAKTCSVCGAGADGSGIILKKYYAPNPSRAASPVSPAQSKQPASRDFLDNLLLEQAKKSYQAEQYFDCIRQLEKEMESGVNGAKRMFGCFLDDSKAFRQA